MTALNYINYGWENSPPPTVLLYCPVSDRIGAQDLSSNWIFRKVQCNLRKPGLTGKNLQSFKSNQYCKTFTQRRQSTLCPAPGHAKFRVTSSQVFCLIQGQRSSLQRTVLTKNKKPPANIHPTHPKKRKQIPPCSIIFIPPGLPAMSVRPQGSTTELCELPEPRYSSPAPQVAAEGNEMDALPENLCSVWQSHINHL